MKRRRFYYIGGGGISWRDPRNWARSPHGRAVRHLHVRPTDVFVVGAVDGGEERDLDLRGMPFASVEVSGFQGRLRVPRGGRLDFPSRSLLGRLRARVLGESIRPYVPRSLQDALVRAGGWQRAVRDGLATLVLMPRGWAVIPRLAGGAPALVSNGTVASNGGGVGAASPAFGQATTAHNLLVATVSAGLGTSAGNFTCSDGTWTRQVQNTNRANVQSAIFYKANCAAGETAPTFSYSNSATVQVALMEFSGVALVSPVDQSGSASGTGVAGTSGVNVSVITAGSDLRLGQLFVTADAFSWSSATAYTTQDSYNNGASPTLNLNNDATATRNHYRFAYGITTTNASADNNHASDQTNIGTGSVASGCIVSFKLGVRQTNIAPYESLRGIAATASDPYSTLTGIAQTSSEPYESLRGIAATAAEPYETVKGIAATGALPYETLLGLVATGVFPFEALLGVRATSGLSYEALAGLALAATAPYEAGGGIQSVGRLPYEALLGVAATGLLPYEAAVGVAATGLLPYSTLRSIAVAAGLPYEALVALASRSALPYETLADVTMIAAEPYEALLGVAQTDSLPYETLAQLAVTAGLPYETLAQVVAALAELPYETLTSAVVVVALPYETTAGIPVRQLVILPYEARNNQPGVTDGFTLPVADVSGLILAVAKADGETLIVVSTEADVRAVAESSGMTRPRAQTDGRIIG